MPYPESRFNIFAWELDTILGAVGGILILGGFAIESLSGFLKLIGINISGWSAIIFGFMLIIIAVALYVYKHSSSSHY